MHDTVVTPIYTLNYCPSWHVCRATARSLSPRAIYILRDWHSYRTMVNTQTVACPLWTTRDTQSGVVQLWFLAHSRRETYEFRWITFITCKASHKVYDTMFESSDSSHNYLFFRTQIFHLYPIYGQIAAIIFTHAHANASDETYHKIHSLPTHYQSCRHIYCTRRRTEPRRQSHGWDNIDTYYRCITHLSKVKIQWSYPPINYFSTFKPPQNEFWR